MSQSPPPNPPPGPPPNPPPPPRLRGTRGLGRMDPLRAIVGTDILPDLWRNGLQFQYQVIENRLRAHPQYRAARRASRLHQRYGDNGAIRSALAGFVVSAGPFRGTVAFANLPVQGSRAGVYRPVDLLTLFDVQTRENESGARARAHAMREAEWRRVGQALQDAINQGRIGPGGTLADLNGGRLVVGFR